MIKKIIIFGAGQIGQMYFRLLNPATYEVLAFADNNPSMQGKKVLGIDIVSAVDAIALHPDLYCIALNNLSSREAIKTQLIELGVTPDSITICDFEESYNVRLAVTKLLSEEIINRNINGAIAELGVFQGAFAQQLNMLFPERPFYLFDTFEGFDPRDVATEDANAYSNASKWDFSQTGVEFVLSRLPYCEKAIVRKGYFPETAEGLEETFALVSLDPDLYQPTYEGLKYFYPRMSLGGVIVIHDYNNTMFKGVKEAVNKYCMEHGLYVVPLCDLHGTAILIKK